jgi:hypothetical protein
VVEMPSMRIFEIYTSAVPTWSFMNCRFCLDTEGDILKSAGNLKCNTNKYVII